MRDGVPSHTSFAVSFARGLGVGDGPIDPLASQWLPRWMGYLADAPTKLGPAAPWYRRIIRSASLGMIDHVVLRTAAIDEQLSEVVRTGLDQVVILGAGLDARAWRMPILVGATVYEVDHPATQRFKQSRMRETTSPTEIRYVPVDFGRQSFSEALLVAGFDRTRPTAWIWEGVTMYLSGPEVADSLDQMTDLSAPKSALLMTYRTPHSLPFGRLGNLVIPWVFAAGGEPLEATFEPSEVDAWLAPAWTVEYDGDANDWRRFTAASADPAPSFLAERLAVARRGP